MHHKIKMTRKEKFKIWLELCDFTFRLMQRALSPRRLALKLQRMRAFHLEEDRRMLESLGRVKI